MDLSNVATNEFNEHMVVQLSVFLGNVGTMEARAQAHTTMTQKGGANGITICCRKVLFGRCVVLGDNVGPNSPVMFPSSSGASFAEDLLSHLNQQSTHTHTLRETGHKQTTNREIKHMTL